MTQDGTKDRTPEEWREPLLDSILAHIPFDGWTIAARENAARDLGISSAFAELAFMGGVPDMLDMYVSRLDAEMLAGLGAADLSAMKVRERVTLAVKLRVEAAARNPEIARRTATALALPQHAPLAARIMWRTADSIWRALDDSSTDFNWYSKRLILMGVYASTMTYLLSDVSDGHQETYNFLDRRIANVMQFEGLKAKARGLGEHLPDAAGFLSRLRYPG